MKQEPAPNGEQQEQQEHQLPSQQQRPHQKGFAHIGIILLIIAVIAALGFGGWYVWSKNKKDDAQSSNNATTQTDNSQATSDPTEGGKYLVISEWGVRFPLPEELRGDIYYQLTQNEILKAEFASFASQRLDDLATNDVCSFKNNPQNSGLSARLLRGSHDGLADNPDYLRSSRQFIATINEYEYYFVIPGVDSATCATAIGGDDPIPGLYDAEQSISNQLEEAFKSLEIIQQ